MEKLALEFLAAFDKFMNSDDQTVHINNPAWSRLIDASFQLRLSLADEQKKKWHELIHQKRSQATVDFIMNTDFGGE